jgi:predicted Zn-dependent protease
MKPIWMHVTFGTVILVGAVVLIRSQNRMVQITTRETITDVIEKSSERIANKAETRVDQLLRRLLGSDYQLLADGTGTDADRLVPSVIQTAFRVLQGVDGANQDLMGLSLAEERVLGKDAHQLRLKSMRVYYDPILNQRLWQLAEPILKECKRKGIRYTITVVDNPEINAAAAMGGYIYVYTGLIAKYPSDAELQFALAHEIGHVDMGHPMRMFAYMKKVSEHLGKDKIAVAADLYSCIARGYSSDLELQADAFAYRAMRKHGRTSDEAMAFARRAVFTEAEDSDTVPSFAEHPDNLADAIEATLHTHFKTHPPATVRLKRLEALARTPQARKSSSST